LITYYWTKHYPLNTVRSTAQERCNQCF